MKKNTSIKKVAIYCNAFHEKDGGGISYVVSIAHSLLLNNYSVDVYFNSSISFSSVSEIYSINSKINLLHLKNKGIRKLLYEFFNYSLLIRQSTSIPGISLVSNSYILCDFPFQNHVNFKSWLYLKTYKSVIVNSGFTGKWVAKKWNKTFVVIYPPINYILQNKKEHIILSVGRIVNNNRSKNFPILIENFKKMVDNGLKDWRFIIAGFVYDDQYLSYLKLISVGYPIHFDLNMPAKHIENLYSISSIYWHACGYHIDEHSYPHLVEHYGITIAQALVSGVVPLAISKGGAVEIIEHESNGFLWNEIHELYDYTWKILFDNELLTKMSATAIENSNHLTSTFLDNSILSKLNIS